jgi:predicted N-acetyltransferase YhbS
MKKSIKIMYLVDHPEWVTLLARWSFQTWGSVTPGSTLERAVQRFEQHARSKDLLPLTVVATDNNIPVGMCSLRENDGYESLLSPWLASLFVLPEYRSKGIGKMLVRATLEKAKELGFRKVFLYTFNGSMPEWYESNFGWAVIATDILNEKQLTVMQIVLR